jgi:hypothetical protein
MWQRQVRPDDVAHFVACALHILADRGVPAAEVARRL